MGRGGVGRTGAAVRAGIQWAWGEKRSPAGGLQGSQERAWTRKPLDPSVAPRVSRRLRPSSACGAGLDSYVGTRRDAKDSTYASEIKEACVENGTLAP